MKYEKIKNTLSEFYFKKLDKLANDTAKRVFDVMDQYDAENPGASSYRLKAKLYETIADECTPIIFEDIPFCFELGALVATSDGKIKRPTAGEVSHANTWLVDRNTHIFEDADPEAFDRFVKCRHHFLFLQCGYYVDMLHNGIPFKKIFRHGLSGIYDELVKAKDRCTTDEERDFIDCATRGILAVRKMQLKLSAAAEEKGLFDLAKMTRRVPWEAPKTYHEGLATLAFMRKALASIEGVGFSSFGRVDVLLTPLYQSDVERCVTREEMLDLTVRFLLIWDTVLDRSKKLENSIDYELENSLTLGGCDEFGEPFFSEVTKMFIEARDTHNIVYPKMMLRFSSKSPEEYLRLTCDSLLKGKSFSLFENDDSMINALVSSGIELADARDYVVGGCWDTLTPDVSDRNCGEYFNLLRPLEWTIHKRTREMEQTRFYPAELEDATTFDEFYNKYLETVRELALIKSEPASIHSRLWPKVNPECVYSALTETCITKLRDITADGGKYNREAIYYACFAEATDSLLAIKKLCFDEKKVSVERLFEICRWNWSDEVLRRSAISAPSWGDGSEESSRFAGKFFDDLYKIAESLPTAHGGHYRMGFNLYTEIIWIGRSTLATPNGRLHGDNLSQGISPSRLLHHASVTDIVGSMRYMDMNKSTGNASITMTLPAGNMDMERITAFLRAIAKSKVQALQINCIDKKTLLAAREEPEKYSDLIVRVCGFSAPFVCLSEVYQAEVISRLFSE